MHRLNMLNIDLVHFNVTGTQQSMAGARPPGKFQGNSKITESYNNELHSGGLSAWPPQMRKYSPCRKVFTMSKWSSNHQSCTWLIVNRVLEPLATSQILKRSQQQNFTEAAQWHGDQDTSRNAVVAHGGWLLKVPLEVILRVCTATMLQRQTGLAPGAAGCEATPG